jgi:hypothetical protein
MINENLNKEFHWKNKLEELESLPGEIFNKEAAWGKLHTRLQPKAKNKKINWYWIAAACLFFALFISFFLSNRKENVLVKNHVSQKKINSSSPSLINKDTSVIITSSLNENKIAAHSINKIEKINTAISHKTIPAEIVQDKKEENISQEIKNNAVMPVDTATSIVTSLPEKKKLKVVHINELGIPVSEPPVMARNSENHSFQLKLLNQEVYIGSSLSANSTRFKIFTTKTIPSN